MQFKDKVVLVTGASRGIGKDIAVSFAREGATVALCARSVESLEKVSAEITAAGGKALCVKTDVSNSNDIQSAVEKILDSAGRIDILVNNAGVTKDNLIARMSEDDWDTVISVNLKGTFFFTKIVGKTMMKQKEGKIINISSVVGLTGNAGQANYAASKAGVIGLTKSVARELAKRNICVNAVAPGFINTDMTGGLHDAQKEAALTNIPMARFGETRDIAEAVLFLASDKANYITGQVLVVDGGMVM